MNSLIEFFSEKILDKERGCVTTKIMQPQQDKPTGLVKGPNLLNSSQIAYNLLNNLASIRSNYY